jgi:SAM-dependent methyltransferase
VTDAPTRARLTGGVAVTPRPLAAYRDMFLLTDDELRAGPILDCPAGASPFGALVRALGGQAVSVDPAYGEAEALVDRVAVDIVRIADWQRANPAGFNWSYLGSPEGLARTWTSALEVFAADFAPDGSRYVAAALPHLPFPDDHFALALSGFLLFVYPELFGEDELVAALRELARVTRGEVRVYPLTTSAGEPYAELPAVRARLAAHGVDTEIRSTGCTYATTPDSDRMLVCRRRARPTKEPK